ncbi:MAG: hypothetical protein HXY34_11435 [Candidatus Thorarchaeota archaeon]|nr:hypothetical protein [Candidatus Thorarchaeota archaeon]
MKRHPRDADDLLVDEEGIGARRSIRLVRGCPCYKVFGDEKLCVNDDTVQEMDVIEVDPTLFSLHADRAAMEEERANSENICYCSVYVNYPDNRVYCISQGWMLKIHGREVLGNDLEDALQFLTTKDVSQSAEICSECLYKFLLTLSDQFADAMTRKEKTDEVKRYVDKFSLMIALKHSQIDEMMEPIGSESDIKDNMDHFAFLRRYLVQLLEQQSYWGDLAKETSKDPEKVWMTNLLRDREKLARFEFQFYSQTLQLRDIYDFNLMIKMLSFILKTADEILSINERIHSQIRSEHFKEALQKDPRLQRLASYADKSRTIEHNFGNILQILSRL